MKQGSVLANKYEILQELGRGGMSVVYLAVDRHLHKKWAIKVLQKGSDQTSSVLLQAIKHEAAMLRDLDHPCLPRIVDILEDSDRVCIVMDHIEGESLDHILETDGAQSQNVAVNWGCQLCELLQYLHTQTPPIIYRDLKPANIMVCAGKNLRLIDFGTARFFQSDRHQDTHVLGTEGYASPEQFSPTQQSDIRSDIYSLGATLFHIASGHHPMEYVNQALPSLCMLQPKISDGFDRIVHICMAKQPHERFQSAAEVTYALSHMEEYTSRYRRMQSHKIKRTMCSLLLTLAFFMGAAICQYQLTREDAHSYATLLRRYRQEINEMKQLSLLHDAIRCLPNRKEAYVELIKVYERDARFTLEEEADFKQYVQEAIRQVDDETTYGELCYAIGRLYWYYYDYGKEADPPITRMRCAAYWFEEAAQLTGAHARLAHAYAAIGRFHEEITLRMEEALDEGSYRACWKELSLLYTQQKKEASTELIQFESDRLIAATILHYADDFYRDGIREEELRKQLAAIQDDMHAITASAQKARMLKEEILLLCAEGEKRLKMVYRSDRKEEANDDKHVDEHPALDARSSRDHGSYNRISMYS